jgi:hypothetical protein
MRSGTVYRLRSTVSRIDEVSDLRLRGMTTREIADELHLDVHTVRIHLHRIRTRWRSERVAKLDEHIYMQLQKLAEMERQAWSAWEDSRRLWADRDVGPLRQRLLAEGSTGPSGDPQYLAVVLRVIDRRCRLLGLDANNRVRTDVVAEIRKMASELPMESRRDDLLAAADAVERAREVAHNPADDDEVDEQA